MTFLQTLASRVEASPGEPLLFFRRDLDWGWLPYRWLPEVIAELSPRLAGVPSGAAVAFADPPSLAAFALDMTLLDGGWVSMPLAPPDVERNPASAARAEARLYFAKRTPWIALEVAPLEAGEIAPDRSRQGGFFVADRGGENQLLPLSWLSAGAEALAELLGPATSSRLAPPRDILITWRPWNLASERALLAWALASGAAVVFEPQRSATAATVAWLGPTVLQGTARELDDLAERFTSARRSMTRRRLRRLRAVLVDGGKLAPTAADFFRQAGARILQLAPALAEIGEPA